MNLQRSINEAIANTKEDGFCTRKKGVYVDLRLGNLCNSKCRMCNPGTLTQWVEEWNPKTSMMEQTFQRRT